MRLDRVMAGQSQCAASTARGRRCRRVRAREMALLAVSRLVVRFPDGASKALNDTSPEEIIDRLRGQLPPGSFTHP